MHIADVSHFVKAGSYTDREAKERQEFIVILIIINIIL